MREAAASRKYRRSPPLTPQTGWSLTSHIAVRDDFLSRPPPHKEPQILSSRLFVILVGIRISAPLVIDIVKDGSKEIFRFEIFDGMLEQLTGSLPCANHEKYLVGKAAQDVTVRNGQNGRCIHYDMRKLLLQIFEHHARSR